MRAAATDPGISKALAVEQRLNAIVAGSAWTDLSSSLTSAFSIPTGGFFRYRVTIQNELQISACLAVTSGAQPATINSVAISSVPATTAGAASTINNTTSRGGHWWAVSTISMQGGGTNPGPRATISSDGFVVVCGIGTLSPNSCGFDVKIPLDV